MSTYISRFRSMVDELKARPDVVVTRFWVGPPVAEATIAQIEEATGVALSDEILGFYREANGLALQWFAEGVEGFEPGAPTDAAPFEWVPEDGYQSGVVNVLPLEQLAHDHPEELWFDFMDDEPPVDVGGQELECLAFHRGLRAVDYFDSFRLVALSLAHGGPNPPLFFGDDHGADFTTFPPAAFGDYLEAVLRTYGSYRQRVRRYFSWPPARDLPYPSLDQVIAECQVDEDEWAESLEDGAEEDE